MGAAGQAVMTRRRPAFLALVRERGLSTTGFRKAMKALVAEFFDQDEWDNEQQCFWEWFARCDVVPAGFSITRDLGRDGIWGITVDIYEVEGAEEIPEHKLQFYGDVADGDGPLIRLHTVDKYDREVVIDPDHLMSFMFADQEWARADLRARMKIHRGSGILAQHHAKIVVDEQGAAQRRREIADLKSQLASISETQTAGILQDVIYGLGRGTPRREIANKLKIEIAVVRAIARLLDAKTVDPKAIVRDTHARWKIAYDAVREMGIEI